MDGGILDKFDFAAGNALGRPLVDANKGRASKSRKRIGPIVLAFMRASYTTRTGIVIPDHDKIPSMRTHTETTSWFPNLVIPPNEIDRVVQKARFPFERQHRVGAKATQRAIDQLVSLISTDIYATTEAMHALDEIFQKQFNEHPEVVRKAVQCVEALMRQDPKSRHDPLRNWDDLLEKWNKNFHPELAVQPQRKVRTNKEKLHVLKRAA